MKQRILIVEDDRDVRISLKMLLESEGYEVTEAEDGKNGIEAVSDPGLSLVLLDIKLPDISGFDVCKAIRKISAVPIIMVTAQTDPFDVVAGLESGADDYITKPYVSKELAARLRANLRRAGGELQNQGIITRGHFEFRVKSGEVRKNNEILSLTPSEYRLFMTLAEKPGQLFDREQLARLVWGYDYIGQSRLVDVHVRRLRTKIESDPGRPINVITVRGLGYKFVVTPITVDTDLDE
jgi:DNA-binding response OmpR family regulator